MANENSQDGGSFQPNLSGVLALLTVVGGVWLVSHKLSSDRPVAPAGKERTSFGDQRLESRLWEDPLKNVDTAVEAKAGGKAVVDMNALLEQICDRSLPGQPVQLLPVMVSGGPYSEDLESRIRSRMAVISALGRSGYAPEDAEHIGDVVLPWPPHARVVGAKSPRTQVKRLWPSFAGDPESLVQPDSDQKLHLRYEWYQPRIFSPDNSRAHSPHDVLVLWLDDSCFEDEPLIRLPLLLQPIVDRTSIRNPITLIGPRRSSTLRAMLPGWGEEASRLQSYPTLLCAAKRLLGCISIYSATSSAMDEVLVKKPSGYHPRQTIGDALKAEGFAAFHNFAATDAQMSEEILKELSLRGVDLQKPDAHIVLISEWDTFYARMLSLTYSAGIAALQATDAGQRPDFRKAYIDDYISGARKPPANFHSFVYLQGLDGETVAASTADPTYASAGQSNDKMGLSSIEDVRHWTPDVNKAEGPAQFDYLSRIGDQVTELQRKITREGGGRIQAIGIVGSDTYDTLLILQALRSRFPDAWFFTTDLDIRFAHPDEREWARNLIVASSYGLVLHPDLQQEVAPFRDSTQTAQFAATLAALGNEKLAALTDIPPRRFEIGNRTAVDISTRGSGELHPLTASETYWQQPSSPLNRLWLTGAVTMLLLAGGCYYWEPLRRLTIDGLKHPCRALSYSEEDVGGATGAGELLILMNLDGAQGTEELLKHMDAIGNPTAKRMLAKLPGPNVSGRDSGADPGMAAEKEARIADTRATWLVAFLNCLLDSTGLCGEAPVTMQSDNANTSSSVVLAHHFPQVGGTWWAKALCYWGPTRRAVTRYCRRRNIDGWLTKWSLAKRGGGAELGAAIDARMAALEIFRLRCRRLFYFWLCTALFTMIGVLLGESIWIDAHLRADGDQFSLTSGTSAWPCAIVRFLAVALAANFCLALYHRLRETFFHLTRKFRLAYDSPELADSRSGVCALNLWHEYWKDGRFPQRLKRIAVPFALYWVLAVLALKLSVHTVFNPLRGPLSELWNPWLLLAAGSGFLLLAFLTIDAAALCRKFILALSAGPTEYPRAPQDYFSRLRGKVAVDCLDEWIDLQLVAELTERVNPLVYYPSILLLVLFLARNSWWDCWSWPAALIVVFIANLILSLASVVILQRAAKVAKKSAEESLTMKVTRLKGFAEPNPVRNDANQAEALLQEIRDLRRGAFVPFWENPVVGAVFLSSGGTTLFQLVVWFMGR